MTGELVFHVRTRRGRLLRPLWPWRWVDSYLGRRALKRRKKPAQTPPAVFQARFQWRTARERAEGAPCCRRCNSGSRKHVATASGRVGPGIGPSGGRRRRHRLQVPPVGPVVITRPRHPQHACISLPTSRLHGPSQSRSVAELPGQAKWEQRCGL